MTQTMTQTTMTNPDDTTRTGGDSRPLTTSDPTVARLIELQGDQSDAAFARRWLTCTAGTWSRVRGDKYHAKDHTALREKLEGCLSQLEDHVAANGPGHGTTATDIVDLPFLRQALAGVRRAFAEQRDRLVVVLGPTGAGKTTVATHLAELYHGRVISCEATETWRSSYLAACHGVMTAAGIRELPTSKRAAEAALIDELRTRPRILVIDEAHYFGPATVNLVKLVLNRTRCTVVALAIPILWERMKRTAWQESEQLRSRACAVVASDSISSFDVGAYLAARLGSHWTNLEPAEAKALAQQIATSANQFGQMSTVARITRELDGHPIDREHVSIAIRTIQQLRR